MSDIQTRAFSKDYSGLLNQSVIAVIIASIAITVQETFKRRRRGRDRGEDGLGSRETWNFGYLYNGRSWARKPSPASATAYPLAWIMQAIYFSEDKMRLYRGIDAALYTRWLRGCFCFGVVQSLTTFPILFPIHYHFSAGIPPKSMTRASIASLVLTDKGKSLLWIHVCLLIWITISWIFTLIWIIRGAFRMRSQQIEEAAQRRAILAETPQSEHDLTYYPPPHPQFPFQDVPPVTNEHMTEGLRLRSVMVSSVHAPLRDEKELKEYFEYYMSRPIDMPTLGLTTNTQPGFFHKIFAFAFNRAKRLPQALPAVIPALRSSAEMREQEAAAEDAENSRPDVPEIERVVICRKMTELASLLERREDVLRRLETAHIKLAKKVILAVKAAIEGKPPVTKRTKRQIRKFGVKSDPTRADNTSEEDEKDMQTLIEALAGFVNEFDIPDKDEKTRHAFRKLRQQGSEDGVNETPSPTAPQYPPFQEPVDRAAKTIWEALFRLDRRLLDPYQPLVSLSRVYRGKTVPAIDYYTAKLGLLTSLITENRAKPTTDFDPVSTAFVTFAKPEDARRACKYLAVHPNNPLACAVTMAPLYDDIDWWRVMKSNYTAEFLKDWVVSAGVWTFTIFWLFPLSLLVGLVSIQNISIFLPRLAAFLSKHAWEEDLIQSFIPTLLVSLLALLIPPIQLLIAKKAHTITTISALHDMILSRYYKFLIVNVLVFFCVGTAALQTFLDSFKAISRPAILNVIANSFPTAGPFYVGWFIFTVAMHGGLELGLLGLPLILYPTTKSQVTPRKRTVGIRPRTFNFYYWLPMHLLVLHILLLFAVLNPLLIPFATIYYFIESGIVKNQLIHVYAKNYELNGQLLLIRMVRYSLDGLMLSQAVFLAYMAVLQKTVNLALAAVLIILTAAIKLFATRVIRSQFEAEDIAEAAVICGDPLPFEQSEESEGGQVIEADDQVGHLTNQAVKSMHRGTRANTWRLPTWASFNYETFNQRAHHHGNRRRPNPFGPYGSRFERLTSIKRPAAASSSSATGVNGAAAQVHFNTPGPSSPEWPRVEHIREAPHNSGPAPMIDRASVVVPHPRPVPWDDMPTADPPYDNPYYARHIQNVLWLPRDPFGVLDLDDTIDFRATLTSDSNTGQIGSWLEERLTASPRPMALSMNSSSSGVPTVMLSSQPQSPYEYTGDEEITLPPAIARRVQSIEEEEDTVEPTLLQRPSTFSRKRRISSEQGIPRRASTIDAAQLNSRTFSGTSATSTSLGSPIVPLSDLDLGARPDAHAQADFVRSTISLQSALSNSLPGARRGRNITTSEAVAVEVAAEEADEYASRIKEEQKEVDKDVTSKRSLWTSWLFNRSIPEDKPGSAQGRS